MAWRHRLGTRKTVWPNGKGVNAKVQQEVDGGRVAPKLHSTSADDASPTPLSARKQRSARRLQEFQEKKRAALIAKQVAMGMSTEAAEAAVRCDEAKRLEQRTAMENYMKNFFASAPLPDKIISHDEDAGPKRARVSAGI